MTNSKIRNVFETLRSTSNHPLVNRTVTVCYDEWHIGTITWYNTKLDECRVLYADKLED